MIFAKFVIFRFFVNFLTVASCSSFSVLEALDTMFILRIIFYQPFRGSSTADSGPVTMLALPEQTR